MNISKTLFKELTRCSNAPALYNMYKDQGLHEVKGINIVDLEAIKHKLHEIGDDAFDDEKLELERIILSQMFDDEDGEDLLEEESIQLKTFQHAYKEVEILAGEYVKQLLGIDVITAEKTNDQKKFQYSYKGNTFYCYLDIYAEEGNKIKVFEVKASTSRSFDKIGFTIKQEFQPFFKRNNETNIIEFIGNEYLNQDINGTIISQERILKALNSSLDRYNKYGKHFYDIAIQKHIIEESFNCANQDLPEIDYYLVVLNHEYIYKEKKINGKRVYEKSEDGQDLFKVYHVNYIAELYQHEIVKARDQLIKHFERLEFNNNCMGKFCRHKKSDKCKFFDICHMPVLVDGSIFDYTQRTSCFHHLTELNAKKERRTMDIYELINQGIYTMKDAAPYIIAIDQQIELDCFLNNTQYFNLDNIRFLINQISYPLYHLDFESYMNPLPRFDGEHPYTHFLFQYSLHIERTEGDCELDNTNGDYHREFFAKDHSDCRRALAEQMIRDIDLSNGGTVLVYNDRFEKGRIEELAKYFPDLSEQLMKIHNAVFDLEKIIHAAETVYKRFDPTYSLAGQPKFNFYDKNLHASFSIKKLLPIFTSLTYNDLEVGNGNEAMYVYSLLEELTAKERAEKYDALKIYCRQDTWSMVEILWALKKLI